MVNDNQKMEVTPIMTVMIMATVYSLLSQCSDTKIPVKSDLFKWNWYLWIFLQPLFPVFIYICKDYVYHYDGYQY